MPSEAKKTLRTVSGWPWTGPAGRAGEEPLLEGTAALPVRRLVTCLMSSETIEDAVAFASGMGAIASTIFALCSSVFTASGSVSDYDDTSVLREKFATAAGSGG